jgi:hypothetical protein
VGCVVKTLSNHDGVSRKKTIWSIDPEWERKGGFDFFKNAILAYLRANGCHLAAAEEQSYLWTNAPFS